MLIASPLVAFDVLWSMITLFYKQWSLSVNINDLHNIRIMSVIKNFSFISATQRGLQTDFDKIFIQFSTNSTKI